MTAKEYLLQIQTMQRQIDRLHMQIRDTNALLYMVPSPSDLTRDRVQRSPDGDRIPRLVAKLQKMEHQLIRKVERLTVAKQKVTRQIESMDNERYKTILYMRYVLNSRWDEIADEVDVDVRHVFRMHGRALQEFEKIMKCH